MTFQTIKKLSIFATKKEKLKNHISPKTETYTKRDKIISKREKKGKFIVLRLKVMQKHHFSLNMKYHKDFLFLSLYSFWNAEYVTSKIHILIFFSCLPFYRLLYFYIAEKSVLADKVEENKNKMKRKT